MTINEFESYKKLADKVLELLIKENHSSIRDIEILYNLIRGYPYCVSTEGQYIYGGQLYNSLEEFPDEGLHDLLYRLLNHVT